MEDNSWGNGLIICKDNRIYDINPQFIMREIDDYACHGFHVDVLQSVLDSTVGLPAEERILKAVKFTGQLYKEDMFPLIIADTSTKQFKFIMKEDN